MPACRCLQSDLQSKLSTGQALPVPVPSISCSHGAAIDHHDLLLSLPQVNLTYVYSPTLQWQCHYPGTPFRGSSATLPTHLAILCLLPP